MTTLRTEKEPFGKGITLNLGPDAKTLDELVVLQCMEDVWNPAFSEESRQFFLGGEFLIWAERSPA